MKPTDLNYSEYWNHELNAYNKRLIPLFVYLSIVGLLLSLFVDFFILPSLFPKLAIMSAAISGIGLIMVLLFKNGKLKSTPVELSFLILTYVFFAYGASQIESPQAMMIWNVSVAFIAVLCPVFILIRHHNHCITTNLALAGLYMSFFELDGHMQALEVLELGGSFIIFALIVSPFIAFFRYQIYSDNAFLKHQLESYATFDSLTGLFNRRVGITHLEKEMQLAQRHHYALSIIYIDVDFLKTVNDTLGHEYGDDLIITVAEQLKSAVRKSDVACRMGGDEFLLILHECDAGGARTIMNNLENEFERINNETDRLYRISVSSGIAEYPRSDGMTFNEFIKIADDAMYLHKNFKLTQPK